MADTIYEFSGTRIFECAADGRVLKTERDAVDLIGATASADCAWTVVPVDRLAREFFSLRTRLAGEFLQKFVTYGKRIAIIGQVPDEFSESRALNDFMKECNRGQQIWFVRSRDELKQRIESAL